MHKNGGEEVPAQALSERVGGRAVEKCVVRHHLLHGFPNLVHGGKAPGEGAMGAS